MDMKKLLKIINVKRTRFIKAWELTKELNAWSEYFSDIANLIQKKYLDSETEKLEQQSLKSIEHSEKVVLQDRHKIQVEM